MSLFRFVERPTRLLSTAAVLAAMTATPILISPRTASAASPTHTVSIDATALTTDQIQVQLCRFAWREQNPPLFTYTGVSFPDRTHGWAVAYNGDVVNTTNGGTTWGVQNSASTVPLRDVNFPTLTDGWAVGGDPATIRHTANGGASWATEFSSPEPTSLLDAVAFVRGDPNNGWAVGVTANNGFILHRSGTTWTQIPPSAFGTDIDYLTAVAVTDANDMWAVGLASTGPVMVHTADGGTTWTEQHGFPSTATSDIPRGVSFVDNTHGWVVGDNRLILHTGDGGLTWTNQTPPGTTKPTNTLFRVSFPSPTQGWTVGTNGIILSTTDAGQNWNPQPSGTDQTLFDVGFVDPAHGWTVGTNTILKFR